MRWLDGLTNAIDMNLGKLQEMVRDGGPGVLQSVGPQRVGRNWGSEQHQETGTGFPGALAVENPLANTEDMRDASLIPGSGRSSAE